MRGKYLAAVSELEHFKTVAKTRVQDVERPQPRPESHNSDTLCPCRSPHCTMFIKQFSPPRCGSNYVMGLLRANFENVNVLGWRLGWKHGPLLPKHRMFDRRFDEGYIPQGVLFHGRPLGGPNSPVEKWETLDPPQEHRLACLVASDELKFVINVRHPAVWLLSVLKRFIGKFRDARHMETLVSHNWNIPLATWLPLWRQGRAKIIRYEDVVADPEGTMRPFEVWLRRKPGPFQNIDRVMQDSYENDWKDGNVPVQDILQAQRDTRHHNVQFAIHTLRMEKLLNQAQNMFFHVEELGYTWDESWTADKFPLPNPAPTGADRQAMVTELTKHSIETSKKFTELANRPPTPTRPPAQQISEPLRQEVQLWVNSRRGFGKLRGGKPSFGKGKGKIPAKRIRQNNSLMATPPPPALRPRAG